MLIGFHSPTSLITMKHGAEFHFVRPDGVYRTSVLQAIPGYQPVSNAQGVAARFTAAPYFATTLSGLRGPFGEGLTWWDQIKIRWAAFVERMRAARAQAMLKKVAATSTVPGPNPAGPPTAVAALPPAQGDGQYGVGPANEAMAKVGAAITAGLVRSGDDALPPAVAQSQWAAGTRIAPSYTDMVQHMAAMAERGQPPFIGQRAYQSAYNRFRAQRTWWWLKY